jgi:hypothetical protein
MRPHRQGFAEGAQYARRPGGTGTVKRRNEAAARLARGESKRGIEARSPGTRHALLRAQPAYTERAMCTAFFDNTDVKLRAPFDAQRLMAKLGVKYRPINILDQ